MKYLLKRDTVLATISVFLVIFLVSVVPFNTHVFDPFKAALSDIKFSDLAFSAAQEKSKIDSRIVIVNIGDAKRGEIAACITELAKSKPKVIGLDVLFQKGSDDTVADNYLKEVIRATPNLVLSQTLVAEHEQVHAVNFYEANAPHAGYANFIGEEKGVIRNYSPFEEEGPNKFKSFTSAVTEVADKNAYTVLAARNKPYEIINYKRTYENYLIIPIADVIGKNFDTSLLTNRIVLVGYINEDPRNIEDKHFTPLNEKFLGKSIPDMNGLIIHANILSMILDGDYIKRLPGWLGMIFVIGLTYLHLAFFINHYIHRHIWFHLVFKVVQLVSSVALIYIGVLLLYFFNISVDFTLLLGAILLSVDVLYIYEAFAKWLHTRFNIPTIFMLAHH